MPDPNNPKRKTAEELDNEALSGMGMSNDAVSEAIRRKKKADENEAKLNSMGFGRSNYKFYPDKP